MKFKIDFHQAIVLLVLLNISTSYGQMLPYGESGYTPESPDFYAPPMIANVNSQAISLPIEIDNSTQIYFPKQDGSLSENFLYNQERSGSCVFASTMWYQYTYEINRFRNLASNNSNRRYSPNAGWNHYNGGLYSSGSSFHDSFNFLEQHGAVCQNDWGNIDPKDTLRWLHGFTYYNYSLNNKISGYEGIKVTNGAVGLELIKHYLNDHNKGSDVGGLLVIGLNFGGTYDFLPAQSNYAGQHVTTSLAGCGHAITIVGYCDNIMYDFNGDGMFTNDIDQNGDNIIDIRDWEIGGLRLVNSYGTGNGTNGFWWLPYRFLANRTAFAISVIENEPQIVLRIELQHEIRKFLSMGTGYSELADAQPPSLGQFTGYDFLKLKGGFYPMKGNQYPNPAMDYDPIEMELEFSGNHVNADIGKAFLLIFQQFNLPIGT